MLYPNDTNVEISVFKKEFKMNIGSFVWHTFNGVLRFGTVVRTELDLAGWAHCSVIWHDDGVYDRAMEDEKNTERLYRVDELGLVNPEHLAKSIAQHNATFPRKKLEPEIPAC